MKEWTVPHEKGIDNRSHVNGPGGGPHVKGPTRQGPHVQWGTKSHRTTLFNVLSDLFQIATAQPTTLEILQNLRF